MRIKQFEMKNFRRFRSLKLDFHKQINVFVGINGSGKSSILDCLAVLLSRMTAKIISAKSKGRSYTEEDITYNKSETNNAVTVLFKQTDLTWNIVKTRSGRKPEASTKLKEMTAIVTSIQSNLKGSIKNYSIPLAVYYPVNRAVLDVPLRIKKKHLFDQLAAYDNALIGGQNNFRLFFEWFRNREDIENEKFRQRKHFSTHQDHDFYNDIQLEAVRRAIEQFLPGFSNLRVQRQPLRMIVSKGYEELIINQLSDGEKCLLAMIGDLARRLALANPGLDNPLQGSGFVLIDEIELHLHPKWQRMIVPTLKKTFPNCQFIMTTHSPQVVSKVQAESIWMIESDTDITHPMGAYGLDSNRILENIMNTTERPQEIKHKLNELFQLIDTGKLDTARRALDDIIEIIGPDPELTKANILIRRKEVLGK